MAPLLTSSISIAVQKKLIEKAYTQGERLGLSVWCMDEAGPYQAVPQSGHHWAPLGIPERYPHEYIRGGTAKMQQGLKVKFTIRACPPPLRALLVMDNLTGHKTPDLVNWMVDHGVMPIYTPIGGSWLNMAESIQHIIVGRALSGSHPQSAGEIIDWLEALVEPKSNAFRVGRQTC